MERELRNAVRTRVKNQVMDALADKHEVDLPKAMVHEEIHRMQHDMARQFGGQGMDPHQLPAELFRSQAERRVKLGLLMSHVVDEQAMTADDARVEAMLDDIAAPYDEPEQVKSCIGYSGIGYKTSGVKVLALSVDGGQQYEASLENCISGDYPLARLLYVYVNNNPVEKMDTLTKEFLKFVLSKQGQEIVVKDGYYPLPATIAKQYIAELE